MILLISTCSEKLSEEEFVKPIAAIVGKDALVMHFSNIKQKNLEDCEKIIICGTALGENEYLKEIIKFQWIKDIKKPILGICSGMQIIALQFGGKIIKNKEIGMANIKIKKPNKLFSADFEAYELHGKGLKNLASFKILAESGKGVQAIKHKEKEIYGIMFHPEVRNEQIVKNFLSL